MVFRASKARSQHSASPELVRSEYSVRILALAGTGAEQPGLCENVTTDAVSDEAFEFYGWPGREKAEESAQAKGDSTGLNRAS